MYLATSIYMLYEELNPVFGNKLLYQRHFLDPGAPMRFVQLDALDGAGANSFNLVTSRWENADEVADSLHMFVRSIEVGRVTWLFLNKELIYIIVVFMTCVGFYSGLRTEYFVASSLLSSESWSPAQSDKLLNLWKWVQSLSGLFGFIGYTSVSVFGAPFVVAGLFKMGLPETLSTVRKYRLAQQDDHSSLLWVWNKGTNVVAIAIHHFGAFWLFWCLVFMEARLDLLTPVFFPILLQHTSGVIKYQSELLYSALIGGLDICFQLEFWYLVVSEQEEPFAMFGGWLIYVAHLMWWVTGLHATVLGFCTPAPAVEGGSQRPQRHRMKTVDHLFFALDDMNKASKGKQGGLVPEVAMVQRMEWK